ncbi:MAG: ABC transporter ATP-binding protein [Proteobacteria bacterium]|nr:ABC transporter ATP-binding protein [Pseudomonadota bacterium]
MNVGSSLPVFDVDIRAAGVAFDGIPLFDGFDLHLPAGRTLCLLGPSGVGKSTLLRLVAGLVPASPDTHIAAGDGKPLHGRIAWMAQQDLLCPWLDARGNVLLGSRLRGTVPDTAKADALLDVVGLADKCTAMPATLSGGQRQRVALARTLMEDRPLVLMDEPFGALDAITRWRLQELAATLLAGRTVVLVTHDPREALRLGHEIRVISGQPATVGPALRPAGTAPRPLDEPALLALETRLIGELARADAGAA